MDMSTLRALNPMFFSTGPYRLRSLICPALLADYKPRRAAVHSQTNGASGPSVGASSDKILQVVLVSPQIAGNTGCIARTCAASAVGLHLVEPLGYKVDDTKLKRAGLDYWPYPFHLFLFYFAVSFPAVGHLIFSMCMKGSLDVPVELLPCVALRTWARVLEALSCKNAGSDLLTFRVRFTLNGRSLPQIIPAREGEKRLLAFTKRGTNIHSDFSFRRGDWLVFGSETCGLPPEALQDCSKEGMGGGTIRIPMVETYVRCLNLSVSVGISLYEAARQLNYQQLQVPAANEGERLFITEDIFG